MTEYTLPEGMTADVLRDLADDPVADKVHAALHAWADAIDPPEPEPIVTDEMVEAVLAERYHLDRNPTVSSSLLAASRLHAKAWLEAVEALGWLRSIDLDVSDAQDLDAWADTIDPPKSIVTDEMIDAVADEVGWVGWGDAEDVLQAVERLGWLRDPNAPPGLLTGTVKEVGGGEVTILVDRDTPWYPYPGGRVRLFNEASEYTTPPTAEADERLMVLNRTLTERLAMAEGLLRKLTPSGEYPVDRAGGATAWCPAASCYVTPDEAEYLRSLDGEGE